MSDQVRAVHYTANYLINPQHPITVNLIGTGGTGSAVLTALAKLNCALKTLEHPGLHVTAWDPDTVTEANIGRQAFSVADVDAPKAGTLITRINRFYGFDWKAKAELFTGMEKEQNRFCNILISCIDKARPRIMLHEMEAPCKAGMRPYLNNYYWMDFGNSRTTGQVVMGTRGTLEQPKPAPGEITQGSLPTIIDMFPDIVHHDTESQQGPSCSFAEAIGRQDLYINSTLAQFGINILWRMIREARIQYHGAFVNMDLLVTNPIPIFATQQASKRKRSNKKTT